MNLTWLVDTGAALSVADRRVLSKLDTTKLTRLPIPSSLQLQGATGHGFKLIALYVVPISVKGKTFQQPVLFVDGLASGAILGMDFLRVAGAKIDASSGQVQFHHEWQTVGKRIEALAAVEARMVPVKMKKSVLLPAGYQVKVPVAVEKPETTGVVVSPEGHVDEAVVETDKKGVFHLIATNNSLIPMAIKRGTTVGHFEEMVAPELIPMDEVLAEMKQPKKKEVSSEKKHFLQTSLQLGAEGAVAQPFWDLVMEFHDVFAEGPADMGFTDAFQHKIVLKHDNPIHQKQFQIPWEHEKFIHEFVNDLLKKKCIRPSNSPYNFPVFCVKKPSGGLRIVNDYRLLNMAAKEDKYVIRSIQECIDSIGRRRSTIFSALDLTNSFWQLALEESSRHLTAFTIPGWGRFEWVTTPMGLHGSPSTFARMMDHVMQGLAGVLTYIDDVLVNSPTVDEHLGDLRGAFERLRKFGLKLNSKKCHLLQQEVAYLGFTLTRHGVVPGLTKLKAVKEFPIPSSIKAIQEFLGLTNYFRHMIPSFARKSRYLSRLLAKDSEWKEGTPLPEDARKAFETLRDELCAKPVLKYPRADLMFHLATDAATGTAEGVGGGFGAVLSQVDDGNVERVVAFASRSLKKHEKNYSAYLAEMAAASWAIDHFHVYLQGREFILYTDHKPLEKMSAMQKKTLNRLMQQMDEFKFTIRHRDGVANVVPDALSRNPVDAVTRSMAKAPPTEKPPEPTTADENIERARRMATEMTEQLEVPEEDIFAMQASDKLCSGLMRWLKEGRLPETPTEARTVSNLGRFCILNDGVVYIVLKMKGRPETVLLVAPRQMQRDIVRAAHASMYSGHGGVTKTILRAQSRFWWPSMAADVEKFVSTCETCQKVNDPPAFHANRAELHPLPVPDTPNFRVHIDLYGPLKTSENGKRSVMVCTDAFTKYVELVAIRDKEAPTVAQGLFERWICRFSAPRQICNDRGKEFVNKLLDYLFERCGISRLTTSAFHPETNGQVERFNRTMRKYLQKVLDNETLDWEKWLAPLAIAYNTQVHQSTKFSPFFLTFLHEPNLPHFDIDEPRMYSDNWVEEALVRLRRAHQLAKENAEEAAAVNKSYYDQKSAKRAFHEGDEVLVHFPRGRFSGNAKLAQNWVDGYKILHVKGNDVYVCRPSDRRKRDTVVHANRLKRKRLSDESESSGRIDSLRFEKGRRKKRKKKDSFQSTDSSDSSMSDSESEIELEYEHRSGRNPRGNEEGAAAQVGGSAGPGETLGSSDVEMPTALYSSSELSSDSDAESADEAVLSGMRTAKLKARNAIYQQVSGGKRKRIDDSILAEKKSKKSTSDMKKSTSEKKSPRKHRGEKPDTRSNIRSTAAEELAVKVLGEFVNLSLGKSSKNLNKKKYEQNQCE